MSVLELKAVTLSFWRGDQQVKALRDVSLSIGRGEVVAVYGKPATGKTSLLKIAAGFMRPDSGEVRFEGQDLSRFSPRQLARLHRAGVGWVERAGPHSGELPVAAYVALSLYRECGARDAQRRAVATLDRLGAAHCAGERWSELSDTDRILVALAQALVHDPRLVVADDPTYGFGASDRERILDVLRSIAGERGAAVLISVPDMPATLPTDRVRLLQRGRLIGPTGATSSHRDNVIAFPRDERSA